MTARPIMKLMGKELLCYNKGCGQKFHTGFNSETSCTFHPGDPVFHDAYKSWSCCKKRSIDFTEFLNIKGCTTSFHNPEKPPEPVKPEKSNPNEIIEYRAPEKMTRPEIEAPMVEIKNCIISPELEKELAAIKSTHGSGKTGTSNNDNNPSIGTVCKNNACKETYKGSDTTLECRFHPGVPIFHEGAKYWSCCNKKTMEFDVFLSQLGCKFGYHCWEKPKQYGAAVNCRHDWHQTATHIIIAIYAKKVDPARSTIKLNPIRLTMELYFPQEGGKFNMDIELAGIVDLDKSSMSIRPTKLEISLKKAEPGSWTKLYIKDLIQRQVPQPIVEQLNNVTLSSKEDDDDADVDLSEL